MRFLDSFGSSIIVFHSPQAGQRPIHLGLSLPQELQYHTDLFLFAIVRVSVFCSHQAYDFIHYEIDTGSLGYGVVGHHREDDGILVLA